MSAEVQEGNIVSLKVRQTRPWQRSLEAIRRFSMLLNNIKEYNALEPRQKVLGVQDGRPTVSKLVEQLHEAKIIQGPIRSVEEGSIGVLQVLMAKHIMKLPLLDRPMRGKAKGHAVGSKAECSAGKAPMLEFNLNVSRLSGCRTFNVFRYKKSVATRPKLHSDRGSCCGLLFILSALNLAVYQARQLQKNWSSC
jgi:hypothetical protein